MLSFFWFDSVFISNIFKFIKLCKKFNQVKILNKNHMFYNKTSLILKLKILPKNPVWMYYRNVILWLRGSVQCYRQFTGKDFFLNLIGIHIERTQRIHCLIQYTGGWAHISLMMFNDFKQTLLLFTHLFFLLFVFQLTL